MDPALTALFQSSQAKSKASSSNGSNRRKNGQRDRKIEQDGASVTSTSGSDALSESDSGRNAESQAPRHGPRKRKRGDDEDDLEDKYMQRIAREQEREENLGAGRKPAVGSDEADAKSTTKVSEDDGKSDAEESDDSYEIPVHESLATSHTDTEIEKANRTVFLANVSTLAIKSKSSRREVLEHMGSFLSELPEHKPPHKIESLRFRSTAFSTASVPKKAAFVKKELMDATTKSTNAYIVYNTPQAAREAVKRLNGTVLLDRHIRVDSVAHPSPIDHRRCVFVGNLGFVDDESMIKAAEEGETDKKPKKVKAAADVEEGLWREFGKAGVVESVRVVRDKTTRVGKGFAYVQFKDQNAVEKALLFHDQKFPPLLPRKLRVTRAKNPAKTAAHASKDRAGRPVSTKGSYSQKVSSQQQSLAGRAKRLLGHAGAAKAGRPAKMQKRGEAARVEKTPEQVVFEGNRARIGQGRGLFKGKAGKAKKQGKPATRSSRRGASFKAAGGKKKRG